MLKPAFTLIAAFCLATAGCASGTGTQRLEREGNASLTGVLSAAPGAVWQGSTSCAGVRIHVTHTSDPSRPLGDVMVKKSRQRRDAGLPRHLSPTRGSVPRSAARLASFFRVD
jgi:hypothetical protein